MIGKERTKFWMKGNPQIFLSLRHHRARMSVFIEKNCSRTKVYKQLKRHKQQDAKKHPSPADKYLNEDPTHSKERELHTSWMKARCGELMKILFRWHTKAPYAARDEVCGIEKPANVHLECIGRHSTKRSITCRVWHPYSHSSDYMTYIAGEWNRMVIRRRHDVPVQNKKKSLSLIAH